MTIDTYNNLNCLQDVSFTAGTTLLEKFVIYDENGLDFLNTIDSAWLAICPYGEVSPDTTVINISGAITDSHTACFSLWDYLTLPLSGKYIQQVAVHDSASGKYFVPAQGTILAIPASGE